MAEDADERDRALYIISVAAELAGVHPQTLRIYERKGLIEPSRTEGRSRRYSDRDIALLQRIQELTNDGVSLAGVRKILELEAELRSCSANRSGRRLAGDVHRRHHCRRRSRSCRLHNPVAGSCSLRDAIAAANANLGTDTINFSASGTITLANAFGQLSVTESVLINGPGAAALTVSGNDDHRIFDITGSADATISGLTLTHGQAGDGGAVRWGSGHLSIVDSIVTANNVTGDGGGLYSEASGATLTIQNSQITDNVAGSGGGGVFVDSTAGVTITDSMITGNHANKGEGGGLYIGSSDSFTAAVLIQRTTISGNQVTGDGGGIYANGIYGAFTVEDSTISNNTATGVGGGVALDDLYGTTTFRNTTISGNHANSDGGGMWAEDMNGGFYIVGSQITGNHAGLTDTDGGGGGV